MTTAPGITKSPTTKSDSSEPRLTPAMKQFVRFKKSHPDCVLFFRMGDFYEMFYEDAKLANQVLGITLTQRSEGVPMAGVPYHAVEGYLQKMIEAGHRVAVCDQIQDPKEAKGIVDRAVTRVVTPGTLVDEALLDESAANQLAAIQFLEGGDEAEAVLAVAELSTGTFSLHHLKGECVVDELARIAPQELLYVETADGAVPQRVQKLQAASSISLTARAAWTFRLVEARQCLYEHYSVASLSGFGIAEDAPEIGPAGALLRYLQETQAAHDMPGKSRLGHLRPPKLDSSDQYMAIDATTLNTLEIARTMRTGESAGSLLSIFKSCKTAMGKRLLRQWLCFPLRDISLINQRQAAVATFVGDQKFAGELAGQITPINDVARIVGRIATRRVTPRDIVALGESIATLSSISELLEQRSAFTKARDELEMLNKSLANLSENIRSKCVASPPTHLRDGGLFQDGVDAKLDEARSLQRDANAWLTNYQKDLIEQTAIPSLKVGYNKVFGYYIEVTHSQTSKVPDTFTRKQTLKNAERYITPQLKEFEEKVLTAQSHAIEREQLLFDRLCSDAIAHASELGRFADIIAELDTLCCFGFVAVHNNFVCPTLTNESVLDIVAGRHPVLDKLLGERFVPNDCVLNSSDQDSATLALITGPNMAGKSTYIRQTALIALLAHTGSFVPAESATIGITDRIFTRIGSADELHAGHSTFMVEMIETANILHHATKTSLVILDEIGRGTSTLDGLSLAWAIAETLAKRGCRTLFATHYHELTTLPDSLDNVRNLHVSVREWGEEIIFLYRILPGSTNRSYGIHVAKLAGLPPETVKRASQLLETLAVQTESSHILSADAQANVVEPKSQMSLFREYIEHPVVGQLRELDLTSLTPMLAFDKLREYQTQVSSESNPKINKRTNR
ncbi:MAG: DNA mismatch repair protein MutS [Planctomycetes bacterium]|nr:DNA mismatch repair protein MutS [Planctomycetota bacterium]